MIRIQTRLRFEAFYGGWVNPCLLTYCIMSDAFPRLVPVPAGITERFGKATMEEVKRNGRARQKIADLDKEYWLTQEVCACGSRFVGSSAFQNLLHDHTMHQAWQGPPKLAMQHRLQPCDILQAACMRNATCSLDSPTLCWTADIPVASRRYRTCKMLQGRQANK